VVQKNCPDGINNRGIKELLLMTSLIYLLQAVVQKNCPDGINSRGISIKGFTFLITLNLLLITSLMSCDRLWCRRAIQMEYKQSWDHAQGVTPNTSLMSCDRLSFQKNCPDGINSITLKESPLMYCDRLWYRRTVQMESTVAGSRSLP
jgi:hypothetical protein